ncbi:MAG: acyloxyacyl hydrolase [Acidobacteriaceae bacterium]
MTWILCAAGVRGQTVVASNKTTAALPDAPLPAGSASLIAAPAPAAYEPPRKLLEDCALDMPHSPQCRVHWHQLIISTTLFNAFEDAGNLYTGYWYRYETTHGDWFDRWIDSAAGWRWNVWADQNPFLDDYVGHPMMGAITNSLWIQNDPRSMTVEQSNTWPYWRRMLRADAFSTFYSFWWKLGPAGEAAIGHNGDHIIDETNGRRSNETGWVELVTTPVGGALWTMAEDGLDKHVVAPIEGGGRNPFALLGLSFLEPAHATANILRFRPPWYRDDRVVKAKTFWSDPPDESAVTFTAHPETTSEGEETVTASSALPEPAVVVQNPSAARPLPVWPEPGGVHEFGAWWGLSLMSGHIWGYAKDVKYMPIDVRYTYLFTQHQYWTMRYAPEMTALAMLDEPNPNAAPTDVFNQRERAYGSGVSPVGFESDFIPRSRVQPFFSTNGGFIYFDQRVLSPEGSQWMYTIDFGTGIHIFRKARQDVTIGYRYQHLSNGNISMHNPGTDANTFYVAISRFRTKGYR